MGGVAFLLLIAIAAEPMAADRAAGNGTCGCTLEVNEVCGFNGVNYTNECLAKCSGEAIAHQGKCRRKITPSPKKRCACTLGYDPVCGTDGNTYGNRCKAACKGVSVSRQGKCRRKTTSSSPIKGRCACLKNYDPVCGADRKTYGNACVSTCSGVTVVYKGSCSRHSTATTPSSSRRRRPCMCNRNYAPVCGRDGHTYSNACEARCSGVSVATQGKCRPATDHFSRTADIRISSAGE